MNDERPLVDNGPHDGSEVLDAGDFGSWLAQTAAALDGRDDADVPCGGCTACCTAAQFIHIGPDEKRTLKRVPKALLFPAPRLPNGHVLMPYDSRGHCPMLVSGTCSIYDDRPRTCRTYDCRVFPASGLTVDDKAKVLIRRQADRWRFSYLSDADAAAHEAALAAGRFLSEHSELLVALGLATNPTQVAVLAVEIHRLFLVESDGSGPTANAPPSEADVRAQLLRLVAHRAC